MTEILRIGEAFSFAQPWWLLAGLLIPLGIWWRGRVGGIEPALLYSRVALLEQVARETRVRSRGPGSVGNRALGLGLLVLALAGPRMDRGVLEREAEGIQVQLALDVSHSMEKEDMWMGGRKVSRFEVVRAVMGEFVEGRPQDRIGVVGFARRAWLLCPPTLDHDWVIRSLERVRFDVWTAIGEGIDTALYFLPEEAESDQVILVLSDGYNNRGVAPQEAAERARARGVRVYGIQFTPNPVREIREEQVLFQVARQTGGRFYQTRGLEGLRSVMADIGKLETGELKETGSAGFRDLSHWVMLPALLVLGAGAAGMWREGRGGS